MKTKDAFALRGFDCNKILQRPLFKQFNFDKNLSDAQILETYDVSTCLDSAAMEARLDELQAIYSVAIRFYRLIKRQMERLRSLVNRYRENDMERKLENAACLFLKYNFFEEQTESLALKFGKYFSDAEKCIQIKCREEFAKNLRRARVMRGMTQRNLAERIGIAPPSLSQYEHAQIEPTIKNLLRLSNVLNISVDALLGRSWNR